MEVPPLRERPEDVPLLAQHFLSRFTAKNNKDLRGFAPGVLECLSEWRWPGNVRELENVIERAVVLSREQDVGLELLPKNIRASRSDRSHNVSFTVPTTLKEVERRMIEETLRFTDGDKSLAASLLGTTARTLYRREAEWKDH